MNLLGPIAIAVAAIASPSPASTAAADLFSVEQMPRCSARGWGEPFERYFRGYHGIRSPVATVSNPSSGPLTVHLVDRRLLDPERKGDVGHFTLIRIEVAAAAVRLWQGGGETPERIRGDTLLRSVALGTVGGVRETTGEAWVYAFVGDKIVWLHIEGPTWRAVVACQREVVFSQAARPSREGTGAFTGALRELRAIESTAVTW